MNQRIEHHYTLTFEDGCELYLNYCRQRNLREGTINHYRQSYLQFFKYIDKSTPIEKITKETYNKFVIFLKGKLNNDVSINAYLRDYITVVHYLMNEEYIPYYKMQAIKVDKHAIATYSDKELSLLLEKPNIKKCSFIEYQSWVITNFLFSTGVRQRSLINIKIADIDFDNSIVNVRVTKNRKALLVPINNTLLGILSSFLLYRQYKTKDDYLFCNIFGKQLNKSTSYHMLYNYNKSRGVETTGIHRYRHTFAKQWILNGGNVVSLSKIMGHSSLAITQNYINLLVSDVAKQVEEIDLINKFQPQKRIKMIKTLKK